MVETKRITQSLISDILTALKGGRNIRMELPSDGTLHLDRKLPFLCLCRSDSPELRRLVSGEAAFLTSTPRRFYQKGFTQLVRDIVRECAGDSGGFLILELWESRDLPKDDTNAGVCRPQFKIVTQRRHMPADTIEALRNALSRVRVQRLAAEVGIEYKSSPKHAGAPILIPYAEQVRLNCFWLGLEVSPVYRSDAGEPYPARHRSIHRSLTRSIKQTVFAFCHEQTNLRPKTHLALGPRGVTRKIWACDRRLMALAERIDFLYLVSPVNATQAWNDFKNKKFRKKPRFFYRPVPFDTSKLKKELYHIPIDELDEPVWQNLYQQKRKELDIQLSMLRDRNTDNFLYGSMQLHGRVTAELSETARTLLEQFPVKSEPPEARKLIQQEELKVAAEALIVQYQQRCSDFSPKVIIRDDITGLLVSGNQLFIGELRAVSGRRVQPLLEHEVGTHLLTYYNAVCQPLGLLRTGLPGYDELQEGIAVLAEYLAGGLSVNRIRLLAGRVLAVEMMTTGGSFEEVYRMLRKRYKFEQRSAFIIAMRIFRSGGLTKDALYLKGLLQVMKHLQDGNPFEELLVGKFNFQHLAIIRELTARNILKPAQLLPEYLSTAEAHAKLQAVVKGLSIYEMIL